MACSSGSQKSSLSTASLSHDSVTDSFTSLLIENESRTESDYLSLAIHELMTEAGFRVQAVSPESKKLPSDWRNGGMYRFNYIYQNYEDLTCSITAMVTGKSLLVTGTLNLDDSDDTYHIKLKTSDFVDNSQLDNTNKDKVFHNLCRLSHRVRHSVVLKMVNEVKLKLGLVEDVGLLTLPLELKLQLITYLDISSVFVLSRVARDLYSLCIDEEVWKRLLLREFGATNPIGTTYREAFKVLYQMRLRERREEAERLQQGSDRARQPQRPEFDMGPDLLARPPPGHFIPGVRGGDYDLFPGGLPRNPLAVHPPDLLLSRNQRQRPPGARYDHPGPLIDDDDMDPFNAPRMHPDNLRRPGFGPDGRFGGPGGPFGGGRFGGGFGGGFI